MDNKIKNYEDDKTRRSKYKTVESLATFRDYQENATPNIIPLSSVNSSARAEFSGVDRADLLIMWNKIREDVIRRIDINKETQKKVPTRKHYSSQQPTKRDIDRELRNSIDKYKLSMNGTVKKSPVKNMKYSSKKISGSKIKFDRTSSFSTARSKDKQVSQKRRQNLKKSKTTLTRLDRIYKELQTLEQEYSNPLIKI